MFPFDIAGLDAIEIDLGDMLSVKRTRREFASQIADVAAAQPSLSPVLATLQLDVMRESDATRSAARGVVRCRRQQAEGDRAASRRAGDADRRVASRDL